MDKINIEEFFLTEKSLMDEKKNCSKEFIYESISFDKIEKYVSEGWEEDKKFKKTSRMKKMKSRETIFFNRIWKLFCNLGFNQISKDKVEINNYCVDVLASDDETVIFIFCNYSSEKQQRKSFIDELQSINEAKKYMRDFAKTAFPDKKKKCAFIFITGDYILPDHDLAYMKKNSISYFDEEALNYYEGLVDHLGTAARFQLLGFIFSGQRIAGMEAKIPAIEGRMGGHKYYSFSIEPERLLKTGYVLHRNNANKQMMPTYQRIIKKNRLKSIQEFLSKGGFFPNSLVINIVTDNKTLRFDHSEKQVEDSISKVGILYLPQIYRSVYIIDGQHRLYGYSNSEYAMTNSIPVVAFVDLHQNEQIKLFMDINENQKAVSKNLRNTLNSDLLWDSENLSERKDALKLLIAQELGEDKDSPLYERVIVGENTRTDYCCVTIDFIKNALDTSDFLAEYNKKNILIKDGNIDNGSNEETYQVLLSFLKKSFYYIQKNIAEEWNKSKKEDVFIVTNAGIYSLIRILNDIMNDLIMKDNIDFKERLNEEQMEKIYKYLDCLIDYYKNVSTEEKRSIRRNYGAGGKLKYWRILQKEINKRKPNFNPIGMSAYWKDNDMRFNEDSYKLIRDIELFIKEDFKYKLESYYGESWFKDGVPKKVYDDANKLASDKNYERSKEDEVGPWECLNLIHYREIAMASKNWQNIFEKFYTMPSEQKKGGKKADKTKWIEKLSKIRNENFHVYSVTESEYDFLEKLHKWLIK